METTRQAVNRDIARLLGDVENADYIDEESEAQARFLETAEAAKN